MAIFLFVHVVKGAHTHAAYDQSHSVKHGNTIGEASPGHDYCDICEFQLAKDAVFTGEVLLVIAPVNTAPTYTRLITAINPDRLFLPDGRGPPAV